MGLSASNITPLTLQLPLKETRHNKYRIAHQPIGHAPEARLIEAFNGLPVANTGDSMNRTFCMHASIRPYDDDILAGPTFTVKVRRCDNLLLRKSLEQAAPGDVIVVDGQGDRANARLAN